MEELLADENEISIIIETFSGTDKSSLIKRTEYGNRCLLLAVTQVLDYIETINETKVRVETVQRIEKKYFDFKTFKETWLNACVHTKWSDGVAPIINIFDDRIEIISNGGLPSALTIEDFYINKALLKIFGDLDYIERTGHGVPLILKNTAKKPFI